MNHNEKKKKKVRKKESNLKKKKKKREVRGLPATEVKTNKQTNQQTQTKKRLSKIGSGGNYRGVLKTCMRTLKPKLDVVLNSEIISCTRRVKKSSPILFYLFINEFS